MSKTSIKLCGMMCPDDIQTANALKPDYIGFVFWERSFRNLTIDKARELKALLNPDIKAVGVFVDADIAFIKQLYDEKIIDIAQLHGSEDDTYIETLHSMDIPVFKAFVVKRDITECLNSKADMLLFDAGKGSGMKFNWELIKDIDRPFFVAGGLDPENVSEAVEQLKPFGVDVSSGIETDRKKDKNKMKDFCEKVRLCE